MIEYLSLGASFAAAVFGYLSFVSLRRSSGKDIEDQLHQRFDGVTYSPSGFKYTIANVAVTEETGLFYTLKKYLPGGGFQGTCEFNTIVSYEDPRADMGNPDSLDFSGFLQDDKVSRTSLLEFEVMENSDYLGTKLNIQLLFEIDSVNGVHEDLMDCCSHIADSYLSKIDPSDEA